MVIDFNYRNKLLRDHRILVLQSVDDKITEYRRQYMQQNPQLKSYIIDEFFFYELTEDQRNLSIELVMRQILYNGLDQDELYDRLKKKVNQFNPGILVIHSGFIYGRNQDLVNSILKQLKSEFTHLTIGFEGHFDMKEQSVFDDDNEIRKLITNIFWGWRR